jgi:hypothetical protein
LRESFTVSANVHRIHEKLGDLETKRGVPNYDESVTDLSRANVGTDEFARFSFGDSTAFDAGIKVPRQIRRIKWTSFDLFFEKALPVLSALYLFGAIGFSAVLVFNAFGN